MSVLIVKKKNVVQYDQNKALEQQVRGCTKVLVNYQDRDPLVEHFLDQVERISSNGVNLNLDIQVNHGLNLVASKAKKMGSKLSRRLSVNDIINMMVDMHEHADKVLAECSGMCQAKKKL